MALVGVQPVLTQVPPTRWRSTTATFIPAPARRNAKDGPAWPVPMIIASKSGMTTLSSSRRLHYDNQWLMSFHVSGGRQGKGCGMPFRDAPVAVPLQYNYVASPRRNPSRGKAH